MGILLIFHRHVSKTDDIKDLVITEESSIAKGIRRIVAVTGHEAHDVSRQAIEFDRKLDRIEALQGKEKEAAMKPFTTVSHLRLQQRAAVADPSIGAWPEQHLPDQEEQPQDAVREDQ